MAREHRIYSILDALCGPRISNFGKSWNYHLGYDGSQGSLTAHCNTIRRIVNSFSEDGFKLKKLSIEVANIERVKNKKVIDSIDIYFEKPEPIFRGIHNIYD